MPRQSGNLPVPIIHVESLVKEFRRPRQFDGPFGGLRSFVTREYETKRAIEGISFDIEEGELIGYLGANGAGKSTSIKVLSGILTPTSGTVEVAGLVPWEDRERNALQIGVVFGQRTQLWWDLPLLHSLKLIGKLYRMDPGKYQRNLTRFIELLDLEPFLQTPVRQLSLGQRMRGDLAAAMLYEPRILYLDEPTVGLDVVAKERTRQFIEQINRDESTTIMLTSHDLADVERLCKRIIFIDKGTVLYDGSVNELKRRFAPTRSLNITLAENEVAPGHAELAADDFSGIDAIDRGEFHLHVEFDPDRIAVTELIGAVIARYQVSDIAIVEPDLEGVVRQIVETGDVRS
jgi:ABC-2 type transport system ATP-binding protein